MRSSHAPTTNMSTRSTDTVCSGRDPSRVSPIGSRVRDAQWLLALRDHVDRALGWAPQADPDHGSWQLPLYPWMEELAQARRQIEQALTELEAQHSPPSDETIGGMLAATRYVSRHGEPVGFADRAGAFGMAICPRR
jgi:hypothetical protein